MNSTGFVSTTSQMPMWRDWHWQVHVLVWVYPAAMLVTAAPMGAQGLSMETARLLCWMSALGLQVLLCPRKPQLFERNDPSSRMKIWPLGLWQDGLFANLWRLTESGMGRIFLPVFGNAVVALSCAVTLGVMNVQMTWNPFVTTGPWDLAGTQVAPWSTVWWMGRLGQAHWILALAALLPAMPHSGGLALVMLLDKLQWREQEARQIRRIAAYATIGFLVLLGVMLVANGRAGGYCVILVALVIGIEARKQAKRDAAIAFIEDFLSGVIDEDDFEEGMDKIDSSKISLRARLRNWLETTRSRRAVEQEKRERSNREFDERRLDEILERIHELGFDSLPRGDRRFLKRISGDYRERRRIDGTGPDA